MSKKLFIAFIFFAIILFASVCFATDATLASNLGNELSGSTNKTEHSVQNAGQGLENVAGNVGNGLKEVGDNVGRAVEGTAQNIGNGVKDMFNGNNNTNNHGTLTATNNGYTATRTSADTTGISMTTNVMIWTVLGIVGVVIASLTWYYVSQNGDSGRKH